MKHIYSALLFWCIAFSFSFAQITWERADAGLEGGAIYAISSFSTNTLYMNTNSGFWKSEDAGQTWQLKSKEVPYFTNLAVSAKGMIGYRDSSAGLSIYQSLDEGVTWANITPTLNLTNVVTLRTKLHTQADSAMLLSVEVVTTRNTFNVYLKTLNVGTTWEILTETEFYKLRRNPSGFAFRVFKEANNSTETLQRTQDGISWENLRSCTTSDFLETSQGDLLCFATVNSTLWRSSDQGKTWQQNPTQISSFSANRELGKGILATYNALSNDNGKTWQKIGDNVYFYTSTADISGHVFYSKSRNLLKYDFAQKRSSNVFSGKGIPDICFIHQAGASNLFMSTSNSGNYFSINGGITWQEATLPDPYLHDTRLPSYFAGEDKQVFAYNNKAIYRSEDLGQTWREVLKLDFPFGSYLFVSKKGTVFIPTQTGIKRYEWINGAYQSISSNITFETQNTKIFTEQRGEIYFTPIHSMYFRSKDDGKTWEALASQRLTNGFRLNSPIPHLLISTHNSGFHSVSVDDGTSWTQITSSEWSLGSFLEADQKGRIWGIGYTNKNGITIQKLLVSVNFGATWKVADDTIIKPNGIFIDGKGFLFVFGQDGLLRSTIPVHNLTAVAIEPQSNIPKSFATHAAFPNPFSSRTTLGVSLAQAGKLSVVVYNALGQRIHTLSDTEMPAGMFKFEWDASNLPSGVYFARIEANGNTKTEKLVVMR